MNDYEKRIKEDLPQQFKHRERINGLIEAVTEQFQDIADFYAELKADRFLSTAKGRQLDLIGKILVMSRLDAMKFLALNDIPSDDQYRVALKYKSKLNFAEGTYKDIIDQIRILDRDGLGFTVSEYPQLPATVVFETREKPNSSIVNIMIESPVRLAAGVGMAIRTNDSADINLLTGVAVQVEEDRKYTMNANESIDSISWFVDSNELIYVDENNNLYIE